ncbi:hypothetical protein AB0J20_16470 [Micromonospora costi]|uniref:hypothetical protein n=1 Tax=Micromonospora costi TaxID=1530042 RepID=UPI00340A441F
MTATAHRIPTWRIWRATLTDRLFGPDHTGADTDWPAQLRNAGADQPGRHRADNTDTVILRLPIGAIADRPEYVVDDLGPWKPWEHELEPARIWRQMSEVDR